MTVLDRIDKLLRDTAVDEIRRRNAPHEVSDSFLNEVLDTVEGRAYRKNQAKALIALIPDIVELDPSALNVTIKNGVLSSNLRFYSTVSTNSVDIDGACSAIGFHVHDANPVRAREYVR